MIQKEDLLTSYVKFLRTKGHRVIQTPSTVWIDVRPLIFQSTPPFRLDPQIAQEADYVFHKTLALACRYFEVNAVLPSGVDEKQEGTILYLLYPPYDLSCLHQKARNQTRRGLERVEVRREPLNEQIEDMAYRVYRDNVQRLGLFRTEKQIRLRWQTWTRSLKSTDCAEFWGAWTGEELVAFSVVVWTPWGVEIVLQRSLASALRLYPNNALVYTIAQDVFARGAALLSFGLQSFAGGRDGLHHFKVNMGFQAVPLVEHYTWHPIVRPLSPLLQPRFLRRAYQILERIMRRRH